MDIGKNLRELRKAKGLSQGAIEKRTGLLRCYVSRVECGHTVPQLDTLKKWAKALQVPLYQVFFEDGWTNQQKHPTKLTPEDKRLLELLKRMNETDRRLWIALASKMVQIERRARKRK